MKRFFALSLVLLILAGCGSREEAATTQGITDTVTECTYSSGFSEELQAYTAPWTYNVVDATGSMHYYFMAGKQLVMNESADNPYKWGDSTFIVFPDGQTMLIDTGMPGYYPVLAENLKRMGVTHLDYLMFSHNHADHTGGFLQDNDILKDFTVGTLYYNGQDDMNVVNTFLRRCSEESVTVEALMPGEVLRLGDVQMEVLWPVNEIGDDSWKASEAVNNGSLVVRFDYKEHSSLFTGDLYESGEQLLLKRAKDKLAVDLLKVPHHGYNTSSSSVFVFAVKPEIAVAMGDYRKNVDKFYTQMGAVFLCDYHEGYMHIWSDGADLQYETQEHNQTTNE